MGTTLLRAGAGVGRGRDGDTRAGTLLVAPLRADGERGGGGLLGRTSGGGGVIETRPDVAASRTLAARSGNVRSGRHSSRPSCHTSESSVTAPSAALRRTSAMRIGPDGDAVDRDVPVVAGGEVGHVEGRGTFVFTLDGVPERARESAPPERSVLGGAGLAAVRLVASALGLDGGRAGAWALQA